MSKLERQLIRAGAVLVRNGKHKVYDLNGQRFLISHGARSHDDTMERKNAKRLRGLAEKR